MSGPWEQYQTKQRGPWEDYAVVVTPADAQRPEGYVSPEIENDAISQGARDAQNTKTWPGALGLMRDMGLSNRDEFVRQLGLTGRAGLSGVGMGTLADKVGLPKPESRQERIVQDAASAMAGGFGAGALAGKLSQGMTGAGRSIAELLKIGTGTQLAATGAAGGSASMANEAGAGPMGQMAAGLAGGVVIPAAAAGVQLAGRGIRNLVEPMTKGGIDQIAGRAAVEAAGPKRNSIQTLLANPDEFVGGPITAGEAAAKAGSAEFSGLQNVVKKRLPTDYDAIAQAQNRARVDTLRSFGGDEAALEAAMQGRTARANANYGAAYAPQIKANPELMRLMENPYIKDEIGTAMKLAEANKLNTKDDLTEVLHFIKIGLDKQLSKTGNDALSSTEQSAVAKAKDNLLAWIAKANPKYDAARATFAADSRPINQMQVGQFLEDKLTAPLADAGAGVAQRAGVYSQAMRDAPGTIKRSTGNARFDNLGQVLEPQQVAAVENVGKSLAQSAENQRLGAIGADRARQIVGDIAPPLASGGFLDRAYTIARAVTNRISGKAQGESVEVLAKSMQNPQDMLRLMLNAKPQERIVLMDYVRQSGNPALIGTMQNAFGNLGEQP